MTDTPSPAKARLVALIERATPYAHIRHENSGIVERDRTLRAEFLAAVEALEAEHTRVLESLARIDRGVREREERALSDALRLERERDQLRAALRRIAVAWPKGQLPCSLIATQMREVMNAIEAARGLDK